MTTKELLALAEKAELPWERYGVIGRSGLDKVRAVAGTDRVGRTQYKEVPSGEHDARYIVAACNAVPDLCRRVEAAEAALRRVKIEADPLRDKDCTCCFGAMGTCSLCEIVHVVDEVLSPLKDSE
jgi:hypothetical protein